MRRSHALLLGLSLSWTAYNGMCRAADPSAMPAEALLARIIAREEQLRDVQAHVKWYEFDDDGEQLMYDYDWGYNQGREFTNGNWRAYDRQPPIVVEMIHAFDGEKLYNFTHDESAPFATGGVYPLDPTIFNATFSPKALLGYSAKSNGHETFGAILSQARTLRCLAGRESINGNDCVMLEAKQIKDGEMTYDVRAWIDTDRGCLPLKIEKYRHAEGANEWKVIDQRFDNIELAQIDGTWFPVKGEANTFYIKDILPPEGMTKEQCAGFSDEEARDRLRFLTAPITKKRRIVVAPDSVRLNQGIPIERFRVAFPVGCRVWDDFCQFGYVVGGYMDKQRALDGVDSHSDGNASTGRVPPEDLQTDDATGPSDRRDNEPSGKQNRQGTSDTSRDTSVERHLSHGTLIGILLAAVFVSAVGYAGMTRWSRRGQRGDGGERSESDALK